MSPERDPAKTRRGRNGILDPDDDLDVIEWTRPMILALALSIVALLALVLTLILV